MYLSTDEPGQRNVPYGFFAEPAANVPCPQYQRGEVEKSRTEAGHFATDVTLDNGRILIADYGVDSSTVKNSTKQEPLLKQWLAAFDSNATYRLRILGYSDCVGAENNNIALRTGRAERVYALLGKNAQMRVTFKGPAPPGTYVSDNATLEGRARNRSVVIEFRQQMQFEPDDVAKENCNRVRTVTIWLNAFIPKDVQGLTKNVPDYGVKADPTMAGKTMFATAFGCGLTDQRSFSADINASHRMHSEAKIDLDRPGIIEQKHHIHPSIQVACLTGLVVCNRTASTAPMSFSYLGVSSDKEIMVHVKGSQGPGCPDSAALKKIGQVLLDAKIDYEGTFFIKRTARNYVDIGFLGHVDLFPAYEWVAMVNESNPVHLGGFLPPPNSSPVTHLGSKRKVHFVRKVWLKCTDGKQTAGAIRTIN
jgi:outer membrane protein OmpA-like peptidoglycan-associated protein